MMKTRTRTPSVDPSARDPIGSWLDVFVGLLDLPREQKKTIRDELDDHLRSRVDDLLITGITESEATQRAVGELGETAELARSFRAAAQPHQTRRLIMTASLFTVIGAGIVLGTATLTGIQPAAQQSHPIAAAAHADAPLIAIRGETYAGLFQLMRAQSDRPVLVHWDRLEEIGVNPDTPIGLDVDPLPSYVVHRLLREVTENAAGEPLDVHVSDELIEVSTRSHFDKRTREMRSYDVRELVELRCGIGADALVGRGESSEWRGAAEGVYESIVMLAEPDLWAETGGDLARGQLIGATLMIDAPARIHERVEAALAVMREDADRTRRLARQQVEHGDIERHKRIKEARAELDELAARYAHLRARCDRMVFEHDGAPNVDIAQTLMAELTVLEVERDLAQRRVHRVSGLIVDLESELQKFSSQRAHTPATSGRGASAPAQADLTGNVYVRGDVARPGVYQLPGTGELDLARLISAVGGAPAGSSVKLERPGHLGFESLAGTLASDMPSFTVESGDLVTVTAPESPAASPNPDPLARRLESIDRLAESGRIDADRAATMRERARAQTERAGLPGKP
ncbi:MAG: hypothetical protein DHS20C14_07370 [Phycisphaeraceae bacterium]|nr:MAG: hypothetical protein DHS20C14_07370 [Phycisphaeraceae bacterium]